MTATIDSNMYWSGQLKDLIGENCLQLIKRKGIITHQMNSIPNENLLHLGPKVTNQRPYLPDIAPSN